METILIIKTPDHWLHVQRDISHLRRVWWQCLCEGGCEGHSIEQAPEPMPSSDRLWLETLWISFDFREKTVTLAKYMLRSGEYHFSQWVIEGSSDGLIREEPDQRSTQDLNGECIAKRITAIAEMRSLFAIWDFVRLGRTVVEKIIYSFPRLSSSAHFIEMRQ